MFDALRREINEILGSDFAVFSEYSTKPEKNEEVLDAYKNVGVLYINYGDLRLLPGNKGLTGSLQLELMLRLEEGVTMESLVSKPLYDLMAHQNGRVYGRDNAPYGYVLNYHMPTSSGEMYTTTAGTEYVVYSLPIDVVLAAQSLMLGEEFVVEIDLGDTTPNFVELINIVSSVLMPNVTPDTCTMINSEDDDEINSTKSSAIARVWGMHIEGNFDATNELHKAIYKALDTTPERTWTIRYKPNVDNFDYTTRKVIFHDSAVSFPRGQFAVFALNMCEAL